MYPKWLEEVCRTPCGKCHVVPTPVDIIAVGIARPNNIEAYVGPLAMLLVECPCCGERMQITLRESVESVVEAIHEFVKVVGEAARNVPPPIQLPPSKPRVADDDRAMRKAADGTGPLRPSRRDNQPDTPPTQREIQAFLHRLRKTSFRLKSKGFTDWMKDMGADDSTDGKDNR
jgi:hypothetical protein